MNGLLCRWCYSLAVRAEVGRASALKHEGQAPVARVSWPLSLVVLVLRRCRWPGGLLGIEALADQLTNRPGQGQPTPPGQLGHPLCVLSGQPRVEHRRGAAARIQWL